VVFTEYVVALDGTGPSLSMAAARARAFGNEQGPLTQTGGQLDMAVEGPGFLMIETPEGNALTRAGSFALSPEGEIVTPDGMRLTDAGGAPVAVPAGTARIDIARDGTLSADGVAVTQLGLFLPADPADVTRVGGTRFLPRGEVLPVAAPVIRQGFLENSNVNAVEEIARMIEVQRAYEAGQSFLDKEDARIRSVLQTLTR
jgi:flagellar basal-body rod protein FlgF